MEGKIYKTRVFHKWCKKEGIVDRNLRLVVNDMEKGQIEASLGGQLYKKRVALGKGKRGGVRIVVAFVSGDKSFFIYGFSKNGAPSKAPKFQLVKIQLM